jgi:carbamoyl-phosphate synthase large subunit
MDINIIGTDIYEREFSVGGKFADKFFRIPPACNPDFIPSLLKICKENNVHVIVPIIDEEFVPISQSRGDFEGVRVMLPEHEQILVCQDKYKTYQFFRNNNIRTPDTWLNIPDSPIYPILMKPRIGRGSKGIKVIHNERELEIYSGSEKHIYQDLIKGEEFTIDTLSDMDGKILAAVPRIRLEIKNGVSYKGRTVKNKIIESACIDICDTLGLKGPACLQCILTDDGPYFFEINPRIGSAVVLSIHAGINIPFLAVKNILGMKVENMIGRFQENVVMLRYWDEIFNLIQ